MRHNDANQEALSIKWITPDRFDLKPDKSSWIEMANSLAEAGDDVTIVAGDSRNIESDSFNGKCRSVFLKSWDLPLLFRISLLINVVRWLKGNSKRSDVILINQDSLLIVPVLRTLGFQFIHLDIRTVPVDLHSIKDYLDKLLFWTIPLKLFGGKVNSYSFITERLREQVESDFNLDVDNYVIWESGVNSATFKPIEKDRCASVAFTLFYHGSISVNRGIGLVIQALPLLQDEVDCQFVIVGDGTGKQELYELSKKMGLEGRVIFKGFMPYEEMAKEIAAADLCICPLTDRPEWAVSSPIKVFEYMACGKPMILTPIPAHKDIAASFPFVVWTSGFELKDFKQAIVEGMARIEELKKESETAPDIVKRNYEWSSQAQKLRSHLLITSRQC
jgi:glycosyltransferase involved in cell wall biosynthesis